MTVQNSNNLASQNKWITQLTSYARGKYYMPAGYYNNSVYTFGGYSNVNNVDIYTLSTNAWTTGANMPAAIYSHNGVTTGNYFWSFGGFTISYQNYCWRYDFAANSWDSVTYHTMPGNNGFFGCCYDGSRYAYVVGGTAGNVLWKFDTANPTSAWYVGNTSTSAGQNCGAAYYDGNVYKFGGSGIIKTVEKYSIANNSWSFVTSCPYDLQCYPQGCVTIGNYIYIICGPSGGGTSFLRYDPNRDVWEFLGSTPSAGLYITAVAFNNKLYAFIGANHLYIYFV